MTGIRKDGSIVAKVMSHDEYVNRVNRYFVRNGFFENEIHRETTTFGNIVNIISTYESRHEINGEVIDRGVNSIQLFYDGTRWWIASAIWDSERKDNPIPKKLLD